MSTITNLPPAPSRAEPSTFSDKADDFLRSLAPFVAETNVVAGEVMTASASAAVSAASASAALANAISVTGAVKWVSGTTYAIDLSVWSPADYRVYRKITSTAGGTIDPSLNATDWRIINTLQAPVNNAVYQTLGGL
jgi:hypothetical protein